MEMILDRRSPREDLEASIVEVLNYWNLDLYTRKPGPAYKDGVFVGTDLDLACFLYALANRDSGKSAVIELPVYRSLRPKTHTEGERVTSKQNRHGRITGLISNRDTFIFSVQILDANVVTTDEVGAPRNFAITKFDGGWYDGWHTIVFDPTAKENDFLRDNDLWSGNRVIFKNFVHPNRWTSFYGQYYLVTKALIQRLREESSFMRVLIKEMQKLGVKYPSSGNGVKKEWPKTNKEKGRSVKVNAFEVEVDLPAIGEFVGCEFTSNNLVKLSDRVREYGRVITKLQFMTRATELAFFNACGRTKDEPLPAWIKNVSWEREYKQKGKRKEWDRLVLFQPKVGELGVSIRKRLWEKTEEVAR